MSAAIPSPPPAGSTTVHRFEQALADSDIAFNRLGDGPPWLYAAHTGQPGAPELTIHLMPLRRGRSLSGPVLRARPPRGIRAGTDRDGVTVVLGYEPGHDVFVAWPAGLAGWRWWPRRLRVSRATVAGATPRDPVFREWRVRGRRPVVVMTPDMLASYLRSRADPHGVDVHGPPPLGGLAAEPANGWPMDFDRSEEPHAYGQATGGVGSSDGGAAGDQVDEPLPPPAAPPAPAPSPPAPPWEELPRRSPADAGAEWPEVEEDGEARVVETGFADLEGKLVRELDPGVPLERGRDYAFWFAVGVGRAHSVETSHHEPLEVAEGAKLTVQVFGFDEELDLVGARRGEVRLDAAGRSVAVRHAALSEASHMGGERRLYFLLRTPDRECDARLRCNVYLGSTLLQSRLVTAQVGGKPRDDVPALRSDLDYHLADAISAERLADVPKHDLSLMVNGAGSSHQFRFFSADGDGEPFVNDASIDAEALQAAIDDARGALQEVAWKNAGEWDGDPKSYRYGASASIEQIRVDLTRLAIRGRRLYTPIVRDLAGGFDARKALQRLMERPGVVQIATASSGLYVPAALFYDHPLEDLPDVTDAHRLCPELRARLEAGSPFAELLCLRDGCPHRDDPMTVCAAGFWGYRHDIGWPLNMSEPITDLPCGARATVTVGVSTDKELVERAAHVERLAKWAECKVAESREELTKLLRSSEPNVIYLYCHGGVKPPNTPYLEIGPRESAGITESYFDNYGIRFTSPHRPLVLVNGCHTTALEPRQVMNLVNGFVQEANAVGVVGTELTVFEPLAVKFAEAMLEEFLDGSATVGAAVRRARLRLLAERNPMGLVYVPFVAAPTRLVPCG